MVHASITPNIIKESSNGFFRCTIQDEMLGKREIECVGEITAESVYSLIRQIRYLQNEDAEGEITMYMNSPGGEVASGLALYDVMKAVSCPIRTVCVGMAASISALIFLSGDKRDILPHGRIMLHDPLLADGIGGSALEIQNFSKNLMKIREITGEIIAVHTGKTIEEVYEKTATDSYFYAEEAVSFGLADNIIYKI